MTCDSARPELKAFLDDELGPVVAWLVRRHLRRCVFCGAELEALRRFNDRLRAADVVTGDDYIQSPSVPRRLSPAWKLAGGALATAALAAVLLILPTWKEAPRGMAAAIAAALSQVNTWHLSGWKEIGGKRVPWDVWGRRQPFLFYEKVGDDITFDDGRQRLRIYPPAPTLHRPVGLVIRTASQEDSFDGDEPSVEDMVGLWDWRQGAGGFAPTPYRRTATSVDFRLQFPAGVGYGVNANQIYKVNRFTWLPEQYQLQFSTSTFHRDVEDLTASYGMTLPDGVIAPRVPKGYSRVSFVGGGSLGMTVQATPMDVDQAGNILVRVRGRLGDVPVTPGSTFTLTAGDYNSPPFGLRHGAVVPYLPMDTNGYQYTRQQGDILLWLAPLEPPAGASSLPAALYLNLNVSVNVQNQATNFVDLHDKPYSRSRPETLLTKAFPFELPLPARPTVEDVKTSAAWHFQWGNGMWPLEYYVDQARASSYYLTSFGSQADVFRKVARDLIRQGVVNRDGTINTTRPIDANLLTKFYHDHAKEFAAGRRQERARAVYWLQREIAALPNTQQGRAWRLITMQTLALYQKTAGQTAAFKQTLRRMIAGYRGQAEYGMELRQAEYTLRTGVFPSDVGYKGPS